MKGHKGAARAAAPRRTRAGKTSARLAAMLLAAAQLAAPLHAAPSGAAFLKINPSPRSYALGKSNVITAAGAQALSGNPAQLGYGAGRYELFSAYAGLIGGAHYGHLAAALARDPSRGFPLEAVGISLTQVRAGGFEGRDAEGNATGDSFGAQDLSVGIGAAVKLTRGLRLGAALNALRSEIAGYRSNTALAADLGLGYAAPRLPLRLGLSVKNLGQGTRFIAQRDPLPASLHAGLSLGLSPANLVLEVGRMISDGKMEVGLGVELGLGALSLRAGYRKAGGEGNLALRSQQGLGRLLQDLSTGIGLRLGSAQFDYALGQQAAEWGLSHRVALTLRWGQAGPPRAARGNLFESPDRGRPYGEDGGHLWIE